MNISLCNALSSKEKSKLHNLGFKYEVMEHYSGGPPICIDCGCHDLRVLELDHINDDGLKERLKHSHGRGSHDYWGYLRRCGYPDDKGLEVRCHECHKKRPKPKHFKLTYTTNLVIEFDPVSPISINDVQELTLWEQLEALGVV